MEKKILFIDTETGGIDPNSTSLLSIGLVAWSNGEILDTKEIFIKHEVFKITPEAINLNSINLVNFIKTSVSPEIAFNEISNFINSNFVDSIGNIVIGGHNTNFDINFLKKFLSTQNIEFEDYFSHRFVDTASILKFLYYAELLSKDVSSSDQAFQYFNINIDNRHSALGDAIGTAQLFSKLIQLVKR